MKRYPEIDIVNMPTANEEYFYTFPVGTKSIILQTRGGEAFKYAFKAGDIALDKYISANRGMAKMEDTTGSEFSITIYFSSEDAGAVMEVELWR